MGGQGGIQMTTALVRTVAQLVGVRLALRHKHFPLGVTLNGRGVGIKL